MNAPLPPNRPLIEYLAVAFPPSRIIAGLEECLGAVSMGRNGCIAPDNSTRLTALQLLLAYRDGKPVERQRVESVNHVADPDADLATRLKRSPALRRMMRKAIEDAEG